MANRNFPSGGKIYSMHVSPVMMDCQILIGATGAVTSFTGAGVASVTRQGTGLYRITMQAQTNFPKLYSSAASMQSPVSGLSGITAIEIANAPNATVSQFTPTTGGVLNIKTLAPAGTLADPAVGSIVNVMLMLSNSSVIQPGE